MEPVMKMESVKKKDSFWLMAFLFVLPISLLLYNYTASKLSSYNLLPNFSYVLGFLLVYSLYLIYTQCGSLFHLREVKFTLAFLVLSFPAYIASAFTNAESYLRFFTLISFVPIGFLSGLTWGSQFYIIDDNKKDLLLTVFLIPAIITAFIIIMSRGFLNDDENRDYVFGVIVFLPLLLYYRKDVLPIILLTLATYICFVSSKRTGLLCVAAIILLYFWKIRFNTRNFSRRFLILLFSLCVVLVAFRYLPNITSQVGFSVERISSMDDESSEARLSMYSTSLKAIRQSDLISLFFGHGCLATTALFGHPTHNDYLEITYDYGLLSLFCIVLFLISLMLRIIKFRKKSPRATLLLFSTLLVFLITTLGNCMFTNPPMLFVLMFLLGFSLSYLKLETNKARLIRG